MNQKKLIPLIAIFLVLVSCERFYKDEYEINLPPENTFNINIPGLVDFEINQAVTPDNQGIRNTVANSFIIENEGSQEINNLKFTIHIYDSTNRFDSNLRLIYTDSIRQNLSGFEKTPEKIFNRNIESVLSKELVEIIILNQDREENHRFAGQYRGEALSFSNGDTIANIIPLIKGTIDYKGDLKLRASGNEIEEFNLSGRTSELGQFIGKYNSSSDSTADFNLKNKDNTPLLLFNDTLQMTLIAADSASHLDSLSLTLIRN